ncbi:hypothetical protein K505DRAFT_332235 [Melanomma pulvis-pyrius CBS 109.77]|uniref:Uncharacterized protein n=1 Tax=Melanomma pulvis-pyrius CBS 109.77 TaxID=1314802 RepID=A0A6A6XT58_9PLEO|nr:hypothetical protein K505DRAFT_332235 [Melanomma pulvis-pyrius CBS 109.77]
MSYASGPTRRLSLPLLEAILDRDDVQGNRADALAILVNFLFFIGQLDMHPHSEDYAMALWLALTTRFGLTSNARQLLSSPEMVESVRIVVNEIERDNRARAEENSPNRAPFREMQFEYHDRLVELNDSDGVRENNNSISAFMNTYDPRGVLATLRQEYLDAMANDAGDTATPYTIDIDDIATPCTQAPADGCPICMGGTVNLVTLNVCGHVFCSKLTESDWAYLNNQREG